jgi:SAM-dependent methyltransferase
MKEIQESLGRMTRAAQRLRQQISLALGPQPEWVKKKHVVDAEFDASLGVETGGITELKRLDVVGDARDGVAHIASDPEEFSSAMGALDIDYSRFTFVDLGAGKGRALLLAARYGFQHIVGVEFARELVEVARRNVQAAGAAVLARTRIIQQDAAQFDLPQEPLVLFLYNPFGAKTMAAVARRARASFDRHRRPLHVVYVVPEQLHAWVDAGFVAERRAHYAILRPA